MALDIYSTRLADEITDDMLATVDDSLDKREGGIIYDMLAPVALEIEMLGFELDAILELGWVDSSEGDYLTRRCAELGVDRKPGEYASGEVTFYGPPGVEIVAGSLVYTAGELAFTTDTDAEIGESGEVTATVTASDIGTTGNIAVGEITSVDPLVENVTAVTNKLAFDGGVDEESDDALKERYYLKVRKPITSGNIYHYEMLALEVKGVGAAIVVPLHAGPGTVKIIIAAENGGQVASEVVAEVQAHIDAQQIIGADALVVSVVAMPIKVSAKLTLDEGYSVDSVTQSIRTSLGEYLANATLEGVVRYAQVGNAIIDVDGVLDYESLMVNDDIKNVVITSEHSAVVGELVLT